MTKHLLKMVVEVEYDVGGKPVSHSVSQTVSWGTKPSEGALNLHLIQMLLLFFFESPLLLIPSLSTRSAIHLYYSRSYPFDHNVCKCSSEPRHTLFSKQKEKARLLRCQWRTDSVTRAPHCCSLFPALTERQEEIWRFGPSALLRPAPPPPPVCGEWIKR